MTDARSISIPEHVSTLLSNEDFTSKMEACETLEDILHLFADKGIELSEAELRQMIQMAPVQSGSGELSEEDLGDVTGGLVFNRPLGSYITMRMAQQLNRMRKYL